MFGFVYTFSNSVICSTVCFISGRFHHHNHNRYNYVTLLLTVMHKMFWKMAKSSLTLNASVDIDVTDRCCDRVFHILGAAMLKANLF